MCEVESDRSYELKWYKNGKEISSETRPPWPYPYVDGTGTTLVQWPYMNNMSRGIYECKATNGVDPPVSRKIKFTPVGKT